MLSDHDQISHRELVNFCTLQFAGMLLFLACCLLTAVLTAVWRRCSDISFSEQSRRLGSLEGHLTFATDLFDASTAGRMAKHLAVLAAAAIERPDDTVDSLPLMGPQEQQLVQHTFNDTAGPPLTLCVHQYFERQAAATPAAECLIDAASGVSLAYNEVNSRANQMAHHLIATGVAADVPVAVMMDKCFEVYIAFIAVLKAGGCYVPIDHTAPAARVRSILQQSGCQLLVTTPAVAAIRGQIPPEVALLVAEQDWRQFADRPTANAEGRCRMTGLVYQMFTSGSTGEPKGVAVPHLGVPLSWFTGNVLFVSA